MQCNKKIAFLDCTNNKLPITSINRNNEKNKNQKGNLLNYVQKLRLYNLPMTSIHKRYLSDYLLN